MKNKFDSTRNAVPLNHLKPHPLMPVPHNVGTQEHRTTENPPKRKKISSQTTRRSSHKFSNVIYKCHLNASLSNWSKSDNPLFFNCMIWRQEHAEKTQTFLTHAYCCDSCRWLNYSCLLRTKVIHTNSRDLIALRICSFAQECDTNITPSCYVHVSITAVGYCL